MIFSSIYILSNCWQCCQWFMAAILLKCFDSGSNIGNNKTFPTRLSCCRLKPDSVVRTQFVPLELGATFLCMFSKVFLKFTTITGLTHYLEPISLKFFYPLAIKLGECSINLFAINTKTQTLGEQLSLVGDCGICAPFPNLDLPRVIRAVFRPNRTGKSVN